MNRCLDSIRWAGLLSCAISLPLLAQSASSVGQAGSQSPAAASSPAVRSAATASPPPGQKTGSPNDSDLAVPPKRMFGMIPDFENTNDVPANQHPLTVREKYILSLHQAFDISAHVGDAFQAALQQAA